MGEEPFSKAGVTNSFDSKKANFQKCSLHFGPRVCQRFTAPTSHANPSVWTFDVLGYAPSQLSPQSVDHLISIRRRQPCAASFRD